MNCTEYKEAITADPTESFDDGAAHAAACESCATYREAVREFDEKIAAALEIEVPPLKMPDLPALDDSNVVSLPAKKAPFLTPPAWIGIAASVALAAVILVQLLPTSTDRHDQILTAQVLEHLDHERETMVVTNVSVSDDRLTSVVPPTIGTLDRDIGLVSYAQSCVINGKVVPHLVIQGKNGPVTLLLMPEEMINGALSLEGESVHGVILPHGAGSIAIIGERAESLDEIEQNIVNSVEWSI